MIDELTKEFLAGSEIVKEVLVSLHFKPLSFEEKGYAYVIRYQKEKNIVEFLFGPSDWDVEMIIYTRDKKFAFRDLLAIPAIAKWVSDNKYEQVGKRNIQNELLWFVELLKISLPIIE